MRNLSTGGTVLSTTLRYDPNVDGQVGAGEARDRSFHSIWPAGMLGSGQFEFIVSTDSASEIFENNSGDTAESNNSARITAISAPDLVVQNLQVDPVTAEAGGSVTVSWDDLNLGLTATPASWNDRIVVRNLSTGETLLNIALPYNVGLPGNAALNPGASLSRSYTFNLPEGLRGTSKRFRWKSARIRMPAERTHQYTAAGTNGENDDSAAVTFNAAAKALCRAWW